MPKVDELRELDDDELDTRLNEYRRELLNLRFQLATGQLDNASRLPLVRRDVARVMTVMRDREIALAEGRDASPVAAVVRPARRPRVEKLEPAEEELVVDDAVDEVDDEAADSFEDALEETSSEDDDEVDGDVADAEEDQ